MCRRGGLRVGGGVGGGRESVHVMLWVLDRLRPLGEPQDSTSSAARTCACSTALSPRDIAGGASCGNKGLDVGVPRPAIATISMPGFILSSSSSSLPPRVVRMPTPTMVMTTLAPQQPNDAQLKAGDLHRRA
jgi:hypothetical protein